MSMPYAPLDGRDWRFTMGLRPLDESRWLEFDDRAHDERALKDSLLAAHYDEVVAVDERADAASRELLDVIVAHLALYFPHQRREVDPHEHPIVAASRLVQEDLCVLERRDAWRLSAACVCFPSRWRLASKLGDTLDGIHAPVPLYDELLAAPTNAFFDRLRVGRAFWRLNWTLLDSPALHQPTSERRAPSGSLHDWFFRVERQTLRRLPDSGAAVFTIRTYVDSAAALVARDETFGPSLWRALHTAPSSVQEYKGWVGVAERLSRALKGE